MGQAQERLHVTIRGRVQGVGFRYAACDMARDAGLTGWVRNLPDGGVEAEFQGPKEKLEAALAWCGHGPRVAHVTSTDHEWLPESDQYDAFTIRR